MILNSSKEDLVGAIKKVLSTGTWFENKKMPVTFNIRPPGD